MRLSLLSDKNDSSLLIPESFDQAFKLSFSAKLQIKEHINDENSTSLWLAWYDLSLAWGHPHL